MNGSRTLSALQRPWGLGSLVALGLVALVAAMAPAFAAEEVVQQGTWTTKGFDVDGGWKIVRDGGQSFVVLDAGFNTKSAPDLKIFLSPKGVGELDNRNATQGSTLVAVLRSNRGEQRYEIPAGTDVGQFRSILIHCEKYSKLWAGAPLR